MLLGHQRANVNHIFRLIIDNEVGAVFANFAIGQGRIGFEFILKILRATFVHLDFRMRLNQQTVGKQLLIASLPVQATFFMEIQSSLSSTRLISCEQLYGRGLSKVFRVHSSRPWIVRGALFGTFFAAPGLVLSCCCCLWGVIYPITVRSSVSRC